MKYSLSSIARVGALTVMIAMAPLTADAGKFRIIVEVESPIEEQVARGALLLGEKGARSYDGAPHQYFGIPVDENGDAVIGDVSASSADAAIGAASGDERAKPEPINLNSVAEIIYDYEAEQWIQLHYLNQKRTANPLPKQSKNPGADILAGMPEGARDDQKAALGALFGQFTKPRVDPKREIKLQLTDEVQDYEFAGKLIRIKKKIAMRLGGKIGEIWTADPGDLEHGNELMEAIMQIPLAASNRPNDPLGVIRQFATAPNGGFMVRFDYYRGTDSSEQEGSKPEIMSRTEIQSYWDAELEALDDDNFSDMVLGEPEVFIAN